MKKGGGSESTIIVGPSKSVLVYALNSLEYVLGPISGVRAKIIIIIKKKNYYVIECPLSSTILCLLKIFIKFQADHNIFYWKIQIKRQTIKSSLLASTELNFWR